MKKRKRKTPIHKIVKPENEAFQYSEAFAVGDSKIGDTIKIKFSDDFKPEPTEPKEALASRIELAVTKLETSINNAIKRIEDMI